MSWLPHTPETCESKQSDESKQNVTISRVLKKVGFEESIKIANTLQGSIWRATRHSNQPKHIETSVIKVTDQYLHQHSITIIKGKQHRVNEDILWEQHILKYLTEFKNCPNSMVKFQRFFKTKTDYFLVMEDGGDSLFDFIQNAHKLILNGNIVISHWKTVVHIIWKQMIECIEFIHSKNVCHFDVSLENFVINDVQCVVMQSKTIQNESEHIIFLTDGIQIKLCDFGLSQLFASSDCMSCKYCGKTNYKSPEVINKKKQFDAKKNDIWALGVCLFMMMAGNAPWNVAKETDDAFLYMMRGKMEQILKAWNLLHYIDKELIDLFQGIFKYEEERMDLDKVKQHSWSR